MSCQLERWAPITHHPFHLLNNLFRPHILKHSGLSDTLPSLLSSSLPLWWWSWTAPDPHPTPNSQYSPTFNQVTCNENSTPHERDSATAAWCFRPLVQKKLDVLSGAGLSKDNFSEADTVRLQVCALRLISSVLLSKPCG